MQLKIRNEQVEELSAAAGERFESALARFLLDNLPRRGDIPDASATAFVRTQTQSARRYGLTSEQEIAAFSIAAWMLGPGFESRYFPAQQLLESDIEPAIKHVWLEQFLLGVLAKPPQEK